MSEFEAYNRRTGKWELLPLSKYINVKKDPKYTLINIDKNEL